MAAPAEAEAGMSDRADRDRVLHPSARQPGQADRKPETPRPAHDPGRAVGRRERSSSESGGPDRGGPGVARHPICAVTVAPACTAQELLPADSPQPLLRADGVSGCYPAGTRLNYRDPPARIKRPRERRDKRNVSTFALAAAANENRVVRRAESVAFRTPASGDHNHVQPADACR